MSQAANLKYYDDVRIIRNKLNNLLAENAEKPADKRSKQFTEFDTLEDKETGATRKMYRYIYMTSLENLDKGTVAGRTCSMTVAHAARCMRDQTHKVATDEEILAWFAEQRRQKEFHDRLDAKQQLQKINLVTENLNPMPAHLINSKPAKAETAQTAA